MILFDVTLQANEGQRESVVSLLNRTMTSSLREAGCLIYRFTADLVEPLRFHLVELWADEADLMAHAKGQPFLDFITELPKIGRRVASTARQGDLMPYEFKRPS